MRRGPLCTPGQGRGEGTGEGSLHQLILSLSLPRFSSRLGGGGPSPLDTPPVPKRTVEERGSREVLVMCKHRQVIERPGPQSPHL